MTRKHLRVVKQPRPVRVRCPSHNTKVGPQEIEYPLVGKPRHSPDEAQGRFVGTSALATEPTCPNHCPWKKKGCSARANSHKQHALEAAAHGWTADQIMREEDRLIRETLPPGMEEYPGLWDFRGHEAGDFINAEHARLLAGTTEWMLGLGVRAVWFYTRRWMEIAREDFGEIQILASVVNANEMNEAHALGFRPAILRPFFPGRRLFKVNGSDLRLLPCPAEVGTATCSTCRRCFDPELPDDIAISFAPHGRDRGYVRGALDLMDE